MPSFKEGSFNMTFTVPLKFFFSNRLAIYPFLEKKIVKVMLKNEEVRREISLDSPEFSKG